MQTQRRCGIEGVPSDVGAAIVGQPFDRVWNFGTGKTPFNAVNHQIANHLPGDPGCGRGPGHDLAIASINCEQNADNLLVTARQFEMI